MRVFSLIIIFIPLLLFISCEKYGRKIICSIEGEYDVTVKHYCWPEEFNNCDTSYFSTMTISWEDEHVILVDKYTGLNEVLPPDPEYAAPNELRFYRGGYGSDSASFRYNTEDKSFSAGVSSGGLGGGYSKSYKGVAD